MIRNFFNLGKKSKELFKDVYEVNFNSVYSFVFSRICDKEITEDIVQDTFISAMKSYDNYKGLSSHKTWLCGIAKNKIFNYYRDTINSESVISNENLDFIESAENLELIIINSESRNVILQTLQKLTPIYKYALILKYMDNYSVKEIAKYLNKTPKSIDGILQRAKLKFKAEYLKEQNQSKGGYYEKR